MTQGNAFLETVRAAWGHVGLENVASILAPDAAYSVAVGAAAAVHGLSIASTVHAFALAAVSNLTSAAIRLSAVGQTDAQRTIATLTAVRPPGRFGAIALRSGENLVTEFREKPDGDGAYINGGFFVLSPRCLDLIDGDNSSWEGEPLVKLAKLGQMMCFEHEGFWQPMDTLRDKQQLEDLWQRDCAPWKIWQ